MSDLQVLALKLAKRRIEALESEIDDYREFVKSSKNCFSNPTFSNKHNLRTMCDYLMKRYISNDGA